MIDALDTFSAAPPFDPTSPLTPTGNLRRRHAISRVAESGAVAAAMVALAVLGLVLYTVVSRGAKVLSFAFLTKDPPVFGGPGGGIAPAIVGTALIVLMAAAIAAPIGVLIALYLTEFAGKRLGAVARTSLDMLNGLPSIVIGVFVFGLLVAGHHQSGFAGAVALSIIMVPLIARATQEMLLLVPVQLREAADALGVSRWRTVVGIVLPSALPGIATGTVLAIARAAGETAPLLLVSSIFNNQVHTNIGQALSNIPVLIFQLSDAADPAGFARAWGAAFVLLAFILITNIAARALLARARKRFAAQ